MALSVYCLLNVLFKTVWIDILAQEGCYNENRLPVIFLTFKTFCKNGKFKHSNYYLVDLV